MIYEGLQDCLCWLEAALKCDNFKWDAGQRSAALDSLHRGVKELWRLNSEGQAPTAEAKHE